jgi:hypothetical protein
MKLTRGDIIKIAAAGLYAVLLLVSIEYDRYEWSNWVLLISTSAGFVFFLVYGLQTLYKYRKDQEGFHLGIVYLLSLYLSQSQEVNVRVASIIVIIGCVIMCLIFVFLGLHIFV